jgi:putative membrane protein insertion efficiency factor
MLFLARLFIRGYQILISPVLSLLEGPGGGCRFEPTCSVYFLQALETHGIWRGTWLGLCRLGRCNPWGGRGHDPVPPKSGMGLDAPTCAAHGSLPHSDHLVCE